MLMRFGLGPVFELECLTAARRWQLYFGRVVFVSLLLVGMYVLWNGAGERVLTVNEVREISGVFAAVVVETQLVMVLLVAPAIAAGAICVDKGRGTLHHVFVTDLSDREIILGKLGSRMLSVFGLMACCAPVLALGGLIGGLDYEMLLRAFILTAGVAVFACSLALFFSIWAKKPHQALLAAYWVLGMWCVVSVVASYFYSGTLSPRFGDSLYWLQVTNPLFAVLTSYTEDQRERWLQPLVFTGVTVGLSAILLLIAVSRLRLVVIRQGDKPAKTARADAPLRILNRIPGPPLDRDPILWREWHRKRPGKWAGRLWSLYGVLSLLASGYVISLYYLEPGRGNPSALASLVNAAQITAGLLLLTISATTTLGEERDRGSLDVILTTPLSTSEILLGKWLGTAAMIPRLAILPIWISLGLAMVSGQWLATLALVAFILSYSAFIASLGLFYALWIPRVPRAIAAALVTVVLMDVGLVVANGLLNTASIAASSAGGNPYRRDSGYLSSYWYGPSAAPEWDWILIGSPVLASAESTRWSGRLSWRSWGDDMPHYGSIFSWSLAYAGLALCIYAMARSTFDRSLGRMTTDLRIDRPTSDRWHR